MAKKNSEAVLRRELNEFGYSLHKSRVELTTPDNLGGYKISHYVTNEVIWGEKYELSLDDVAGIVADLKAAAEKKQ